MQIRKELAPEDKRRSKPKDEPTLPFGRHFTDHMFLLNYNSANGWYDPRIVPYAPFSLDPAALVLHYGQEVFEGLKAYYGEGGHIHTFRPEANIERMNRSHVRMCIPELPKDLVLEGLFELVRTDQAWIPRSEGTSLYIRPTTIATEGCLGVKVSSEYLFYIIMCPVGAYYPEGFNPIRIYVEEKYVRAAAGGVGEAKTSGNYAASLLAAEEAHEKGFTQVLWLDACDKQGIEEVGTMNMFFVIDDEVITPPLSGSILPGITRNSVLEICRHWGIKTHERKITIKEVIAAQDAGKLNEAFGSGTAAVVSPVGSIAYQDNEITIGDGGIGPLARRLFDEITGIQLGTKPDPFNWVTKLD